MNLVPVQRMENQGLNSQMLFHDVNLQFSCGNTSSNNNTTTGTTPDVMQRKVEESGRKTRGLTGFVEEKMYSIEREQQPYCQNQNAGFRRSMFDNSESEDDENDDDDEDDDGDGDGEVEGLVVVEEDGNNKNNNNSSGSVDSGSEKGNLQKHHSSFGSGRGVLVKDNNISIRGSSNEEQNQQGRVAVYDNAVTIAEPDNYYSQFIQGSEGAGLVHKVIGGENGCGFTVKKDVPLSKESGESLRAILSDPVTGTLMDDAMILPCGHSFGSGGMQHVIRMKACYTCSQPVSDDSVASNLSLRSAVQAFRREEELQSQRSFKRRRERFEQNNCSNHDPYSMDRMDYSRGKGVQFPFAVTDRVIIKGNKRTPLRFVGREAVVTTQCLNGWYVVKTLDNAESVKLQYRSLAKVSDNPSSNTVSSKATPSWL